MKNSKFIHLYETVYNRYKQGAGFLEGDVVKLKSDYKSMDCYKSLNETIKIRIETAAKSGFNMRLGRLHTPNAQFGSLGYEKLPATHADVYSEMSPGNVGNLMTVPIDILEEIDTGVNLPPVSPNNKRPNGASQDAAEWESNPDTPETKEQNHLGHEQNWIKKGDYKLAEKDKKSSVGANEHDDSKPSEEYEPLPKNKMKPKTLKESEEILSGLYIKILNEDVGMMGSGAESSYSEEADVCPTCHHNPCTCDEAPVGMAEEEICPACGAEVCGCTHRQMFSDGRLKIEPHHVKDECWNMEENKMIDECWGMDGNIKEECWRMEEGTGMPTNPEVSQETGQQSPTQGEDGPLEEVNKVAKNQPKRGYLPGGHPDDGVTIKAHPNSYLS